LIIDSSVVVCLFHGEPESAVLGEALLRADTRRLSAGTMIELAAVSVRTRQFSLAQLEEFIGDQAIVVEPVTVEHARIGQAAYHRFGLGSGHRARLNLGDCFAYALARATGEPLLFKGDDFNHTDLLLSPASAYPR
jgi:ribonuclease VapC